MSKNNYNRMYKKDEEKTEVITESETEVTVVENSESEEEINVPKVGVVCAKPSGRLNIRKHPNVNSDIVCILTDGDEVHIDENESNPEWYKVTIATGIEGFCMSKFITVTI